MTKTNIPLARRVDLLFECILSSEGKRLRYEDVRRIGGVDPAAISRIRKGKLKEPTMSSLAGLARAFNVSLDYFVVEASEQELRSYLEQERAQHHLDALRARQQLHVSEQVQILAHRASHLDEEGLDAIAGMIQYVLRQKGIDLADEEGEEPSVSDEQAVVDA